MNTDKKKPPLCDPVDMTSPVTSGLTVSQTMKPLPEQGGPKGPEPTRYGDWEQKGRCSDF